MLNMIAQIVITYHNNRSGKPLFDHTCHSDGSDNPVQQDYGFSFQGLHRYIHRYISSARSFGELLILVGHGDSSH